MPLNARQLQRIRAEEARDIANGHGHDPRDRYPQHRRDPFDEVAAFQSSPARRTPAAAGEGVHVDPSKVRVRPGGQGFPACPEPPYSSKEAA